MPDVYMSEPDDDGWSYLGDTDLELVLVPLEDSGLTEYQPGGILAPYSEGDIALAMSDYSQRLQEIAPTVLESLNSMQAGVQRMMEALDELRTIEPSLFEDVEPFVSSDAMRVTYGDGREERPL